MERLYQYLRRQWFAYVAGFILALLTATLAITVPYLTRQGIDSINGGPAVDLRHLAGAISIIVVSMAISGALSRLLILSAGFTVESQLRDDLFAHLVSQPANLFGFVKAGDVMSRAVNDLVSVRTLAGTGVQMFAVMPLYCGYALACMLWISVPLTVLTIVPFLLLSGVLRKISQPLLERSLKYQQSLGLLAARMQESLRGIQVIKGYALEGYVADEVKTVNDQFVAQALSANRLVALLRPLTQSTGVCAAVIVAGFGGWLVVQHRATIGDLAAFMGYMAMLAGPLSSLSWLTSIYQRGKASMSRINDLFNFKPLLLSPPPQAKGANSGLAGPITGAIEFENVSFSYFALGGSSPDGAAYVLRDISFKIPAGGKLGIVGTVGSGKSTLLKLATRMVEPSAGRILLDGIEIGQIPLEKFRTAVSVVPQEPILFSDSLARNISFGRPMLSLGQISAAANVAGLASDLAAMPLGLQTSVGERGLALSGGQKQRVTIARAVACEPAVLVLDDSLSGVDSETERDILAGIQQRLHDSTTIIVSHRATTVRDADHILVLADGTIAERGTHQELMALRGIYAGLFSRQLLEEELASY